MWRVEKLGQWAVMEDLEGEEYVQCERETLSIFQKTHRLKPRIEA